MNISDPASTPIVAPVQPQIAKAAEPIKPPAPKNAPPMVRDERHKDAPQTTDTGDPPDLLTPEFGQHTPEDVIFTVDADPASVFEATVQPELLENPEAEATAELIDEAFQAELSLTALLGVIRGADLHTISLLLGDAKAQQAMMPEMAIPA